MLLRHLSVLAPLLLLLLLLQLQAGTAQQRLGRERMKEIIGISSHNMPTPEPHECVYLRKQRDSYSAAAAAGGEEAFHLDCCGGRRFPICGGRSSEFVTRCCPGFTTLTDPIDSRRRCSQRVLADRDALAWLKDFRSDTVGVGKFVAAFANTFEAMRVLRAAANATWTVFAVADQAFKSAALQGFTSAGGCTNNTILAALEAGEGAAGASNKTEEGTDAHRRNIYLQKCRAFRSNTTADLSRASWKYLVSGRKYIGDLRRQSVLESQLTVAGGRRYPLKFSRYSNGISCIECAPVLEANHEAANAVVHIIGKEMSPDNSGRTVGEVLQQQYGDFWSLLDARTQGELSSSSCSSLYTVFVPRSLARLRSLSAEAAAAAARRHALRGLWCSAGMIDAQSQPLVTLEASGLRFACDSGSRRRLQFGDGFGDSVEVSDSDGEFDVMATNGVIHLVDRPMLPRAMVTLRSAWAAVPPPADADAEAAAMLRSLLHECDIDFEDGRRYIVLLPTEAAFAKLLHSPSYADGPEPQQLRRSSRYRCWLLRQHVLQLPSAAFSARLSRAVHRQRFYSTAAGGRVADFLTRSGDHLTAHFMEAKVTGSTEGREFAHGRLYHIDRVLLPPRSGIWRRMLQSLYSQQQAVLREFTSLSAGADSMLTLLLPERGHRRLLRAATLRRHTLRGVLYLQYLPHDDESIDFVSLAGGLVTVSRSDGQHVAAEVGQSAVKLLDCGVRLPNAVICRIEEPLHSSDRHEDLEDLDLDVFHF